MNKLKIALAVVILSITLGCTSDQDAEKEQRRQNRIEAEVRDAEEANKRRQEAEQTPPQQEEPQQPTTPSEPEYEETQYYMFTSSSVKTPVKCAEAEEASCGMTFKHCENDNTYYCQTNVAYFVKTEKTRVN